MRPLSIAALSVLCVAASAWPWETVLPGDGHSGNGASLAIRADGDLILAHCIRAKHVSESRSVVGRFSGKTGKRRWQVTVARAGFCINPDLVLTPEGDPIISCPLARLSGKNGSIVWSNGGEGLSALALRVDGSLITTNPIDYSVSALDEDTGETLWSTMLDLRPGRGVVAKLSGESGDAVWETTWPGDPEFEDYVEDLAVDAAGDVIAFGASAGRVAVRKYARSSGDPSWHRSLVARSDPLEDFLYPEAVAVDANGNVAVAGSTQRGGTHTLRLHLIGFRDAVAGQRITIRDDGARRTMRLELRDPRIQPAAAGGAGDPELEGATLEFATATGENLAFTLPAEGWKSRGSRGGFVYAETEDGCTAITWKAGTLRARCASGDDAFTLSEPLGEVSVRLSVGAPQGFSQCATFGGTIVSDRAVADGESGRFAAVDAPPPATCD